VILEKNALRMSSDARTERVLSWGFGVTENTSVLMAPMSFTAVRLFLRSYVNWLCLVYKFTDSDFFSDAGIRLIAATLAVDVWRMFLSFHWKHVKKTLERNSAWLTFNESRAYVYTHKNDFSIEGEKGKDDKGGERLLSTRNKKFYKVSPMGVSE